MLGTENQKRHCKKISAKTNRAAAKLTYLSGTT